ncbi:MAG: bifunctional phosphoglucose/phosphomannose isomerase [Ignavibacteria bacterium]|mgnify:CR=1 FL=1|nr:MAG: bifunctional phosphoglucose/phosphomannose isomerase [Ignavibacteria bacterium]
MSTIDYAQRITTLDSHDMYGVLRDVPMQAKTGMEIGNAVNLTAIDSTAVQNLVICGMGGSAIGGDILRVFAETRSPVPISVIRGYAVPQFVDGRSLVIVLSYSGGTEESLSAYADARARGAQCVVVTSGGTLLERAREDNVPAAVIPGGLAPRSALGYLFFPLLVLAARLDIIDIEQSTMDAVVASLESATELYADYGDPENQAVAVAEKLPGRIPVVYAAQKGLDAVLTRWRCQIEENAKMLSYTNVFPEMNHNEIVGWEQNTDLLSRIAVIVLHDREDLPQIRKRIAVTLDLIRPLAGDITEIYADEDLALARVLGLICLGDWVSFYLAMATDMDPYPIEKINRLKNELAR